MHTVKIAPKLLTEVHDILQPEGQVMLHCYVENMESDCALRIWPSTFLVAENNRIKRRLAFVENMAIYPSWQQLPKGRVHQFTLIFPALPPRVKVFNLYEVIPEPGGFVVENIHRNETDVYHVVIKV